MLQKKSTALKSLPLVMRKGHFLALNGSEREGLHDATCYSTLKPKENREADGKVYKTKAIGRS